MNHEFLLENDKRMSRMIYQHWHDNREGQSLDQCLQIYDKLYAIEYRSPAAAKKELNELVGWLKHNGLEAHERLEEINRFVDKINEPVAKLKSNIVFEVAEEATTGQESQVFSRALQTAPFLTEEKENNVTDSPWTIVDQPGKKAQFLDQITPIDGKYRTSVDSTLVAHCPLPWLTNTVLIRVSDTNWVNKKMAIYYLNQNSSLFRLNGTSPPIHEVNNKAPIKLTEENVLGYIRFFCFFVRGEEGPFYIVEDSNDPLLALSQQPPASDHTTTLSVLESAIKPARYLGKDSKGNYLCEAVVFYSNALFTSKLAVMPSGMIEMVDDIPIAGDLSFKLNQPIA